ncbi:hypothetical protein [Nostoc sp.]|uniref:hypothetical protein n=1 Tax=Nostoc sp. TaxID=1180 RepID=UPI002FF50F94
MAIQTFALQPCGHPTAGVTVGAASRREGYPPTRTTENQVVAKPGERVNSLRCADFAMPLFYQAINFPLIDA